MNKNQFQQEKIYDFQYQKENKKISFTELIKNSNFSLDSVLKRSLLKVFQDLNGLTLDEFKNFAQNVVKLDEKILLSTYLSNK
jgi:hypothetical protein